MRVAHEYETTSGAYLHQLGQTLRNPDHRVGPRGLATLERVDAAFSVRLPSSRPITTRDPERNEVIAEYTRREFALYESLTRDVEKFAEASSFWRRIANPDGTVNSAYGWLVWANRPCANGMTPWQWAKSSLQRDRDTRQAYLRFSLPEHQWHGNRDQVCTMHGQFMIRDGALNLSIVMRSCDLVRGLAYDMPWFCRLIERMRGELLHDHPGLQVGAYSHFAHSLHVYEADVPKVRRMLGWTGRRQR